LPEAMARADLTEVLENLPEGMQANLGEGGVRVSGGQGQRVRLARALMRKNARLVILDEPFRGLERERRRELLRRLRAQWRDATILFVSHDVGDTGELDRVLVLDKGTIVEDGPPGALLANPESSYRALVLADRALREGTWSGVRWRRHLIERGQLSEARAT
jgi:ABC-type transport system involved in cytochrome bd biosynthesis fused ATPase/permease subunit